jgi:ATP-dependent DNA helicase RecG
VFPDRVVIYNDGHLPENWTIRELMVSHRSEPRNPMIANTFFRAGMIESWGRGITNITAACREVGQREPSFEFKHGREFSVTFYSDAIITTNITTSITTNNAASNGANETRRRVIAIMSANPNATVKTIAAELGIAERNVKNHIKALKDAGTIERVGATKNGHWVMK